MAATTRLLLVRHGVVHNPENIIYGRLPNFRLSARGELQAQAAGAALQHIPLAAIFTSPLLRAQQTAAHIAVYHPHLKPIVSPWLNEIYIPLEGRPMAEAAARNWDLYTGSGAPYEQPQDIVQRMQRFVEEVCRDYAGQTVAAVTHGDVIAFTVLWAAGRPVMPASKHTLHTIPDFGTPYPETGSITTLAFDGTAGRAKEIAYLRPYAEHLLDPSAPQ